MAATIIVRSKSTIGIITLHVQEFIHINLQLRDLRFLMPARLVAGHRLGLAGGLDSAGLRGEGSGGGGDAWGQLRVKELLGSAG